MQCTGKEQCVPCASTSSNFTLEQMVEEIFCAPGEHLIDVINYEIGNGGGQEGTRREKQTVLM